MTTQASYPPSTLKLLTTLIQNSANRQTYQLNDVTVMQHKILLTNLQQEILIADRRET